MNDAGVLNDIYFQKESGKMIVKDFEELDKEKDNQREKRKREGYGADSDTDSDDQDASAAVQRGASTHELRKLVKNQRANKGATALLHRSQMSNQIAKKKSPFQQQQGKLQQRANTGHFEKFSGDAYKSQKGKGDVIKAGKLEPFSYIQLNPRLLNKRNK